MIDFKKRPTININWNVSPYDYNKESEKNIIEKFSKKYNIDKKNIHVTPKLLTIGEDGKEISITDDVISNIQDPNFQRLLFLEYLKTNEIKDYDFELIKSIDAEINSKIDYDVYEKYKKYALKWIKWDNFLSYGKGNYFDFTNLKNLVLIQGLAPYENQTGKTTFSIDLLHFLLFGNTSKYKVQSKLFNKHLPNETTLCVEGCLEIEGSDYIIKRTLTRPELKKRSSKSKVTQKVEYYKIVGGNQIEISDEVDAESNMGETVNETNKIIKESIGSEYDFDLMISVTMWNLIDLVSLKSTERGQLFSKWVGLRPLEEKDVKAREKFNSGIKPYLLSNQYNTETLTNEINEISEKIIEKKSEKKDKESLLKTCLEDIEKFDNEKNNLQLSMNQIDEEIMRVDINTLNKKIEDIINEGKSLNLEINSKKLELSKIGDINYSITQHDELKERLKNQEVKLAEIGSDYRHIRETIEQLTKSEYCPTCGRKYDNVDNTEKIKEYNNKLSEKETEGKKCKKELEDIKNEDKKINDDREKYENKNKLEVKLAAFVVKKEQKANEYIQCKNTLEKYNKNSEAIDKNNKLQTDIELINENLKDRRSNEVILRNQISDIESEIKINNEKIGEKNNIIEKIKKENDLVKNWKIYLDMVGKNGISKMILRKTLPIINANLSKLLNGVCDFDVEIKITEKNEVMIYLIKDGIYSELESGSGFELTCGALALRSVLSKISTMPRANFFMADEIFGSVAKSNMENMHQLFSRISEDYDFILNVTHDETLKDWFDTVITIEKKDNISFISARK